MVLAQPKAVAISARGKGDASLMRWHLAPTTPSM
jgi:hypothetical protein